jgi:hypothetical protein
MRTISGAAWSGLDAISAHNVMPAQAGIQFLLSPGLGISSFAGMTGRFKGSGAGIYFNRVY